MIKYAPRAALSALMLAGVCALTLAATLAVATALVVAVNTGGVLAIVAAIAVVGMLAAAGFGLPDARRRRNKPFEGVPITSDEQPLLWVEVCIVAETLGMRPPDQLLLVPDAKVMATETRTWLGLRPGVRCLQLGEVILGGLTERQLRAVIAHELCRSWGPSSLGRVIHGGREFIGGVIDRLGEDSRAGRIAGQYGRVYLAVSHPVIRRHELVADTLSADLAGNGATSAALREVAVLSKGWDAFVDMYVEPAAGVRRRPENLFAGFARFLEEPTRRAQLAETIDESESQPSKYHSHPSLEDRLVAIASLAEDNTHDKSGRALDMLRSADRVIRRVEDSMFLDPDLTPATWEEIAPEAGRATAREGALALVRVGQEGGLGQTLTVATLLDLMRYGLVDEMVRPSLGVGPSPEDERELAGRLVTAFLATVAIESGSSSYRLSWATTWQLVDSEGEVEDLPALVDAALADPAEVNALDLWLGAHELGMELELGHGRKPEVPQALPVDMVEDPTEDVRPILVP